MNNVNIDEQLKNLSQLTYPRQVDVVDSVMAEVRKLPPLGDPKTNRRGSLFSTLRSPLSTRFVIPAAAASVALLIGLSVALRPRPAFDDEGIGNMLAYVSDYNYYAPIESAADPFDDDLLDDELQQ